MLIFSSDTFISFSTIGLSEIFYSFFFFFFFSGFGFDLDFPPLLSSFFPVPV